MSEMAIQFRNHVEQIALDQLGTMLSTREGRETARRIALAFHTAMRTSRDPRAFMAVSDGSVADCIATSYDTGLFPGGPNPPVYLVPQAARSGEQPDLQWRLTHRGVAILAQRAGYGILPVPVGQHDDLIIRFGEVVEHEADPSSYPGSMDELVGVILVVRRLEDGVIIARTWVPKDIILKRRSKARTKKVWDAWPVEMAQKTAMLWAAARGALAIDSPQMRSVPDESEPRRRVKLDAFESPAIPEDSRSALGMEPPGTKALPDKGGVDEAEAIEMERELAKAAPEPAPATTTKPKATPKRGGRRQMEMP